MSAKLLAAAALAIAPSSSAVGATELRSSHQWSNNDVRHKVAEIVAHVPDDQA